jgi:DNA-directed RNA polymerase subunit RPC12/RpoP
MPIEIPGKSIRPPDSTTGLKCPNCGKRLLIPKKIVDPLTKKVKLVCPYCGQKLFE